jgi:hypothetical protein
VTRPWDWPPPRRRVRRPPPVYLDAERPPTNWWATPAGRWVGNASFRLGIFVWKVILVCVLHALVIGSLVLLWALIKAMIGG